MQEIKKVLMLEIKKVFFFFLKRCTWRLMDEKKKNNFTLVLERGSFATSRAKKLGSA